MVHHENCQTWSIFFKSHLSMNDARAVLMIPIKASFGFDNNGKPFPGLDDTDKSDQAH